MKMDWKKMGPILLLAACTGEAESATEADTGVEEFSIKVEADRSRIIAEEQDLDETANDIKAERRKLDEARRVVAQQMASLSKGDRKQRETLQSEQQKITRQERELESREKSFETERRKLEQEKTNLLRQISNLTTDNARNSDSASQLTAKIKGLDRLARELGEERERFNAQNKKMEQLLERVTVLVETMENTVGAEPRTVIVQRNVPGGAGEAKATSASVRDQAKKIRRKMDNRGILVADLSPAARELERQAVAANKAKDFDQSANYYRQLAGAVDRTNINAEFVEAKMRRINGEIGKRKPPARVTGLLNEVSASFTDGRYDKANRKINEIYRIIRGS
ncbi:MAG: hypothetical protein AAFU77_14940 [Myxococcota bacterium]